MSSETNMLHMFQFLIDITFALVDGRAVKKQPAFSTNYTALPVYYFLDSWEADFM